MSLTVKDKNGFFKFVDDLNKIDSRSNIILDDIGKTYVRTAKENSRLNEDTGKRTDSFDYKVNTTMKRVWAGSKLVYTPITMKWGRKPAKPPAGKPPAVGVSQNTKFALWAKRKGLNPYAVQKSIAKKGTKQFQRGGRPDLVEDTFKQFEVRIKQKLSKYGDVLINIKTSI